MRDTELLAVLPGEPPELRENRPLALDVPHPLGHAIVHLQGEQMEVDREVVREVTRTVVTIGVFCLSLTIVEGTRRWLVRNWFRS